ncbi:MAG: hypothetical protein ACP5IY_01325 [Halothiobacillaceae bacterium]
MIDVRSLSRACAAIRRVEKGQEALFQRPVKRDDPAHVDQALISAIWFALENDRWVVAGKKLNLSREGEFGKAAGKSESPFKQTFPLKDGVVLVASEQSYTGQGYSYFWYPIYHFNAQEGLRYLGWVRSGLDNTGAAPFIDKTINYSDKVVGAKEDERGMPILTLS